MTTEEQTIEQRIVELESALYIAESHHHYVMARELRSRIDWLKSISNRDGGTK